MKLSHLTRLAFLCSAAVLLIVLVEGTGLAQCAMCRASLAGSNNAFFIRNFQYRSAGVVDSSGGDLLFDLFYSETARRCC